MEAVWHVVINDIEQGPLTKSQVLEHLKDGLLTASNLIWRPGFSEWKSISEVSDFWQPPKRTSAIDAVQPKPIPAAALGRPLRLTAWQRPTGHLGSTLALITGVLLFVSGMAQAPAAFNTQLGGVVMILGALAYRSAKQRRSGEAKSTLTRQFLECVPCANLSRDIDAK